MNNNWQHFIFSLFVQLLLPLMPLCLEFWIKGEFSNETLAISAAMYTISIGVSTRNIALLGVSIFVAMAFSAVFGYLISGQNLYFSVTTPSLITISAFLLIHATERYRRHVMDGELFTNFRGQNV